MKSLRPLAGIVVLIAAMGICRAQSQTNIQEIVSIAREAAAEEPVPEKILPVFSWEGTVPGTYWSLQNDSAPLPFLPFPKLETIEIAPDVFLFDDRAVDYDLVHWAMRQSRRLNSESMLSLEALPPFPDDEGYDGTNIWEGAAYVPPVYGPNDLWLEITNVWFAQDVAGFVVHGTTENILYQIQSRERLESTNHWQDEGIPFPGAAGQNWTAASVLLSNRMDETLFFRAVNYSGDADADGLPNWWEIKYGLDPNDANTTGSTADGYLDSDGDGYLNLEEYIMGQNPGVADPPRPTITISATDASAAEPNNPGQFTISRSGGTARALTVYFSTEGLARSGFDFQSLGDHVTFGIGQSSVSLSILPIDDDEYEGTEDLVLRLRPGLDYVPASTDFATVNLADNEVPPIKVDASSATVIEGSGINGMFQLYRAGDTRLPLTVNFTLTGTATNGVIYQTLPTSITFAAGADATNLAVMPIDNTDYSGETSASLTVLPNAAYRIETNAGSASLTFVDDDLPVVSIVATDSDARESGLNPGRFTVSRTGTTQESLEVYYHISGTAIMASPFGPDEFPADYQPLTNRVTIPSGQSSAFIDVIPLQDTDPELMEQVVLTLAGSGNYQCGLSNSAAVNIDDDEPLSYLCTVKRPSIYGPGVGRNMPGVIEMARTGSALAASSLSWSVTDLNGTTMYSGNYQISGDFQNGSLYFAPNDSKATVNLNHTTATVSNLQFRCAGIIATVPCWGADRLLEMTIDRDEAYEGDTFNKARFWIHRAAGGPSLTVKLHLEGTAEPGVDFPTNNVSSVTFGPNSSSQLVEVYANPDGVTEGWESLVIRFDTSDLSYTTFNSLVPQSSPRQETYATLWLRESGTTGPKPDLDTDRDFLNDAFEKFYGLDPLVADDSQADSDRDGLSQDEEQAAGSDPADADSDYDGIRDGLEVIRGTSPTNALDVIATNVPTAQVNCFVGDDSGSKSERWQLVVGGFMLNNSAPGQLISRNIDLKEGTTNLVRLRHLSSILNPPDLDYHIELRSGNAAPPAFLVNDPQHLLGEHGDMDDGPQYTNKVATVIVPKIELTWQAKGDNVPLDLNTNGYNQEIRGNRIFVGAKTPTENLPRNTVLLKIKTTPPLVGSNVWLRAFDVDDTTPEKGFDNRRVIDTTGSSGDDNFDDYLNTPKTGLFVANSQSAYSTTLDGNGEASVEFRVGMQPGNNYRIAATVFPTNNLSSLQSSNADGSAYISADMDKVSSGFNGALSPLLTVWRKLYLEFDSMEAVPTSGSEANFEIRRVSAVLPNKPASGQTTVHLQPTTAPFGDHTLENGSMVINGVTNTILGNEARFYPGTYGTAIDGVIVDGIVPASAIGAACVIRDDDERWASSLNLPVLPMDNYSQQFINGFTPSKSTKRLPGVAETYAPAFIQVVDVNALGWNTRRMIPFYRNKDIYDFLFSGVFDDARDLADKDVFWAYTVTFGFQPAELEDGDPNIEYKVPGALLGVTAEALVTAAAFGYSAVYEETIADYAIEYRGSHGADPTQDQRSYYKWLLGTCAHEIGHAPGEHFESTDHDEGELMQKGGSVIAGKISFSPITIRRFRTSSSWTGGPQ